jgi:hypothetical protein
LPQYIPDAIITGFFFKGMDMRRLYFALAFCLFAGSAFAQGGAPSQSQERQEQPSNQNPASNVETVLRGFGLIGGPWSTDCSRPEGPNNWYGNFELRNGKVTQVYTNSRSENRYEILEATRISDDRVRVRVRFTNSSSDELQTLEWLVRGDRIRTLTNISDKRGPIVTNGRVNDGETPWVMRCR